MKRMIFSAVLIASCFVAQLASAQTATPYIRHKQVQQQHRIANGVRSGRLTPRETANLERREAHIQHEKRMYQRKGYVTRYERMHMRHQQARLSHDIYRHKHNRRVM